MYKNCIAELVIYLICDFLLLLHVPTITVVVVIDNIFLNRMCVLATNWSRCFSFDGFPGYIPDLMYSSL